MKKYECDLSQFAVKHKGLSECVARFFALQVLDTIEALSKIGVFHWDIKPENFVIAQDFKVKAIDFGAATKDPTSTKRIGTSNYASPEAMNKKTYCCLKNDLYSFAVTILSLILGSKSSHLTWANLHAIYENQEFKPFWDLLKLQLSPEF